MYREAYGEYVAAPTERLIATPLTPRQLAICERIADGWQNKQIADAEASSLVAVKRQIEAIMTRTGALNRAMIAAWYVRQTEVRS